MVKTEASEVDGILNPPVRAVNHNRIFLHWKQHQSRYKTMISIVYLSATDKISVDLEEDTICLIKRKDYYYVVLFRTGGRVSLVADTDNRSANEITYFTKLFKSVFIAVPCKIFGVDIYGACAAVVIGLEFMRMYRRNYPILKEIVCRPKLTQTIMKYFPKPSPYSSLRNQFYETRILIKVNCPYCDFSRRGTDKRRLTYHIKRCKMKSSLSNSKVTN